MAERDLKIGTTRKRFFHAHADQGAALLRIGEKPGSVQFAQLVQIGAANNDPCFARVVCGDGVGNGENLAVAANDFADRGEFIGTESTRCFRDNHVGAEAAELTAQFAFKVGINGQRSGGDGGDHGNRDQRGESAVFAHPGGLEQQTKQKVAAIHASPRRTTAGSNCMALRTAPALPRKVTSSAAKITTASTTGWTAIAEPKMLWPMRWART